MSVMMLVPEPKDFEDWTIYKDFRLDTLRGYRKDTEIWSSHIYFRVIEDEFEVRFSLKKVDHNFEEVFKAKVAVALENGLTLPAMLYKLSLLILDALEIPSFEELSFKDMIGEKPYWVAGETLFIYYFPKKAVSLSYANTYDRKILMTADEHVHQLFNFLTRKV